MAAGKEIAIYYVPEKSDTDRAVKSVLVRMGVRIRNADRTQIHQTVGYLAGLQGFEACAQEDDGGEIPERMLVLYGFGNRRLNELLRQLRRAGAPQDMFKAILTGHNSVWTLLKLYGELKSEAEALGDGGAAPSEE